MKKLGMMAAVAGILSVSAVCFAAVFSTNPAFITSVEIDNVPNDGEGQVPATTSTFLQLSQQANTYPTDPATGNKCTGVLSVITGSAENVRNSTALATAAMLAGKKVTILYSNKAPVCTTYGGLTYGKIADIRVQQ
jgi:hypothetical protein